MKLSKEQLQFIDIHLKDRKIESWDVRYEIVDHIACLTEDLMEGGADFDGAIIEVKKTFTFRYLRKMQFEKHKALTRRLRNNFVMELKESIVAPKFLLKVLLCSLIVVVFYKFVSVNSMTGLLMILLYSPTFVQVRRMIENYQLYGKSLLMSNISVQVFSLPSALMLPIYIGGDNIINKYSMVVLVITLSLIPIMLVWNSLLLKEMKKLKEQYFLIYE